MNDIKIKRIESSSKILKEFSYMECDSKNKVSLMLAARLLEQISDFLKKN